MLSVAGVSESITVVVSMKVSGGVNFKIVVTTFVLIILIFIKWSLHIMKQNVKKPRTGISQKSSFETPKMFELLNVYNERRRHVEHICEKYRDEIGRIFYRHLPSKMKVFEML